VILRGAIWERGRAAEFFAVAARRCNGCGWARGRDPRAARRPAAAKSMTRSTSSVGYDAGGPDLSGLKNALVDKDVGDVIDGHQLIAVFRDRSDGFVVFEV
jgi:hypothetical protein